MSSLFAGRVQSLVVCSKGLSRIQSLLPRGSQDTDPSAEGVAAAGAAAEAGGGEPGWMVFRR